MPWLPLLVAAAATYLLKLAGYLVPHDLLENPRVRRVTGLLPVALLSGLVVLQTVGTAGGMQLDARAVSVVLAVVLAARRVNFLVVVVAAAAVSAGLRALGVP